MNAGETRTATARTKRRPSRRSSSRSRRPAARRRSATRTSRRSTPRSSRCSTSSWSACSSPRPTRVSRRKQRGAPRRAHGHAPHAAQEPAHRRRPDRARAASAGASHPRRLVLLCDISGSMEPYARAYLQFLHARAATGPYAEAFVFATRLTRLTKQLCRPQPAAGHPARGRGGARLVQRDADRRRAEDVQRPLRPSRDGARLGHRHPLRRLGARRSRARGPRDGSAWRAWRYRIVWVNPRVAAKDFAPKAGGLVAALPYCDALVSGHTLKSLEEVADAIAAERDHDPMSATWKIPHAASTSPRRRPGASPGRPSDTSRCPAATGRSRATPRPDRSSSRAANPSNGTSTNDLFRNTRRCHGDGRGATGTVILAPA